MVLVKVTNGEVAVQSLLNECIRELDVEKRSKFQQIWRKSDLQEDIEECLPNIKFLDERELNSRKVQINDANASVSPVLEEHATTWDTIDPNGNSTVVEDPSYLDTASLSGTPHDAERASDVQVDQSSTTVSLPGREAQESSYPGNLQLPLDTLSASCRLASGATEHSEVLQSQLTSSLGPATQKTGFQAGLCLPQHAWQLIDMFFLSTHPWFPVVDKATVLQTAYLYTPGEYIILTEDKCSEHSILWAILAYSSQIRGPKGTVISSQRDNDNLGSQEYYTLALDMIPRDGAKSDVYHVQALLILSLVQLGQGESSVAWSLIGQAARLVVDVGLCGRNDKTVPSDVSRKIPGAHKTFLGCFVLDTILSARLHRTPQLRTSEVLVDSLEESGLDEWGLWQGTCNSEISTHQTSSAEISRRPTRTLGVFNQLCKLMTIWNDATTVPNHGNASELYQNLGNRFRIWKSQLPPFCNQVYGTDQETSLSLPHVIHLHMCYSAALLFLQKQISQSLSHAVIPIVDTRKLLDELKELLNLYITSFTASSTPSTIEIFTHIIGERPCHIDRTSVPGFDNRAPVSLPGDSGTGETEWVDLNWPSAVSNVPEVSPASNKQQPRLFEEFLNLDEEEGNSTSLTATLAPGSASMNLPLSSTSSLLPYTDLSEHREISFVANNDETMMSGTSNSGAGSGTTLDEATLQNMLVAYGVQQ